MPACGCVGIIGSPTAKACSIHGLVCADTTPYTYYHIYIGCTQWHMWHWTMAYEFATNPEVCTVCSERHAYMRQIEDGAHNKTQSIYMDV